MILSLNYSMDLSRDGEPLTYLLQDNCKNKVRTEPQPLLVVCRPYIGHCHVKQTATLKNAEKFHCLLDFWLS